MKKNARITAFVSGMAPSAAAVFDPHYAGYFTCFNRGDYYEAHDVLEQLWLVTPGKDHLFYKGLIQVAGAFVHLQKQFLRPEHPKDRGRLRPAVRLFDLGSSNLAAYGPQYLGLDVAAVRALCAQYVAGIVGSGFEENPWTPERLPNIELSQPFGLPETKTD